MSTLQTKAFLVFYKSIENVSFCTCNFLSSAFLLTICISQVSQEEANAPCSQKQKATQHVIIHGNHFSLLDSLS